MKEIIPSCPVEVGDRFYRKNYCNSRHFTIPDRIEVVSVEFLDEPVVVAIYDDAGKVKNYIIGYYKIHGRYMYHTIGPDLEKDFCDIIFRMPDTQWVIEKKGEQRTA